MKQTVQAVAVSYLFHDLHRKLVLIRGDIRVSKDRRKLVLRRSNFVVLRLGKDAHFPQFQIEIPHERCDARTDRAEIVILQLLTLGRRSAEQSAAAQAEILALEIQLFINEEILLLRADRGGDASALSVSEQAQDAQRLAVDRLHRAQQGRLFVEGLAAVGVEHGRNVERIVLDESVGGRIPCGIAACLKGGAQAAGRKLEASGSPLTSSLPENSMMMELFPSGERKLSCFSAVMPVIGWNQWVKWVAPFSTAQSFMALATTLAMEGSSFLPSSIVRTKAR